MSTVLNRPLICQECSNLHYQHRVACSRCGSYTLIPYTRPSFKSGNPAMMMTMVCLILIAAAFISQYYRIPLPFPWLQKFSFFATKSKDAAVKKVAPRKASKSGQR